MDQEPRTTPVAVPAGGPRRASFFAAAIVVALVLAVVKPWSLGQAGPATGASGGALPIRATPTSTPGDASPAPSAPPGDPNAMACLADETEQVLTVERSADREVRSWIAVPDLVASGPLDPRLVPLTIFSSHVVGLGVCAASANRDPLVATGAVAPGVRSGATIEDVQSITIVSGRATAVDLGPPTLLASGLGSRDAAVLYGPAQTGSPASPSGLPSSGARASPTTRATDGTGSPSPSPAEAPWRAGSYAIAFRFPFDDATVVRWLRIDLVTGAGGL